jgi:hypothetical protein
MAFAEFCPGYPPILASNYEISVNSLETTPARFLVSTFDVR